MEIQAEIEELFEKQELNCAQTTTLILAKAWEIESPEELLKIASFYGGGIGRNQATCGALIGALNMLAFHCGSAGDTTPKSPSYQLADKLYKRFTTAMDSADCKNIRKGFDQPRKNCHRALETAIQGALELAETAKKE